MTRTALAPSRWRPRRWIALIGLVLLLGLGVRGYLNAIADPVMRATTVTLNGWPEGAAPLRVALIADIHLGNPAMDEARLTRIVGQVNAAHPDLVLIAGDFLVGHDGAGADARAARLTKPLSALHAPLGVVAVLGNHDWWTAPAAIQSALAQAGVVVLDNAAVRRGPIVVAGVSDRFSGHARVGDALASARALAGPIVVLTHSPDVSPDIPREATLVLAGHTHCGQVVAPGVGALVTRAPAAGFRRLYDPRYRCGLVRDPGRLVIITGGLGSGTAPVRFGAPPDWWLIRLTGPGRRQVRTSASRG